MIDNIMAIMQDDLVMMALPLFFLALLIEWLWARKQLRPIYEHADFMTSMGVMVLTPSVAAISS